MLNDIVRSFDRICRVDYEILKYLFWICIYYPSIYIFYFKNIKYFYITFSHQNIQIIIEIAHIYCKAPIKCIAHRVECKPKCVYFYLQRTLLLISRLEGKEENGLLYLNTSNILGLMRYSSWYKNDNHKSLIFSHLDLSACSCILFMILGVDSLLES